MPAIELDQSLLWDIHVCPKYKNKNKNGKTVTNK